MGPKVNLDAMTDEEREAYLAEQARIKQEKEEAARQKKQKEKLEELKVLIFKCLIMYVVMILSITMFLCI